VFFLRCIGGGRWLEAMISAETRRLRSVQQREASTQLQIALLQNNNFHMSLLTCKCHPIATFHSLFVQLLAFCAFLAVCAIPRCL
jgi:hypothetical protein